MNFVLLQSFKLNEVIGIVLMVTIQLYLIGHYDLRREEEKLNFTNELNDLKKEIKKIIVDVLEQDKKTKEKEILFNEYLFNDGYKVIDTEENFKEYDKIFR